MATRVKDRNVEFFEGFFVKGKMRRKPFIISPADRKEFTTSHQVLQTSHIEKHLNNEIIVGARINKNPINNDRLTDRIILDLDKKAMGDVFEACNVTNEMLEELTGEKPHLTFTSSESGNLHTYLMLGKSINEYLVNDIRNFLQEQLPKVEVYPSSRAIRLPLGKNSYLLDNYTYDVLRFDKNEQIEVIYEMFERGKIDPVDVATLRANLQRWRSNMSDKTPIYKPRSRVFMRGEFRQEVDELRDKGITVAGTRNESMLKLVAERMVDGDDEETIINDVLNWQQTKHNFNSKDVANGKVRQLEAEIRCAVKNFDFNKGQYGIRKQELNQEETIYIKALVHYDLSEYTPTKQLRACKILNEVAKLCKAKKSARVLISKSLWNKWGAWQGKPYRKDFIELGYIKKVKGHTVGRPITYHCQFVDILVKQWNEPIDKQWQSSEETT